MRQYRALVRSTDEWMDDKPMLEGRTVFERDGWQDSGLLDASGNKLMARDRVGPIGFVHFKG